MARVNIKINLPGGIVSIGDLQNILEGAERAGAAAIQFGNRQQLYFDVEEDQLDDLTHHFFVSDTLHEVNANEFPNIISSYVSEDLFDCSGWLREGVYKDILDSFSFTPKLKINLVDSSQTFIPFFSGNMNFISSEISNYWYLYVRFPKTNTIYCWSTLIYSEDIPEISRSIEGVILSNPALFYDTDRADGRALEQKVASPGNTIKQAIRSPLQLPAFDMTCYEGFNMYGDKYWLGIYRRNEQFPITFLKALCEMCIRNRIGQIYTTPWKSIIIKEIPSDGTDQWRWILQQHEINIRHAATELNWQTEDLSAEGLQLKLDLAEELNREDQTTGKLCFAIKMNPKSGLFGSVIIRKTEVKLPDADYFDVLHTAGFNPNSKQLIAFKKVVPRPHLGKILKDICRYYIDQTLSELGSPIEKAGDKTLEARSETVFQCSDCLTIYDEELGDSSAGVPPGTSFEDLPDSFRCPLCEAEKTSIVKVKKHKIYPSM